MHSRISWNWYGLILLGAIVVRLAISLLLTMPMGARSPYAPFLFPDCLNFFDYAQSLVQTGTYVDAAGRQAWRTPGFSLYWAFWLGAGLRDGIWLYAPNIVLGSMNAVIAAWVARAFFASARAGILAGLGIAFYPFLSFLDALPLGDTLAVTAVLFLMAAAHWYAKAEKGPAVIFSALALGGAGAGCAYAKASLGFLLLPVLLFLTIAVWKRSRGWRFFSLAITGAAFTLAMLPWWSRNERIFGTLVPFSTMGGFTLWEATGPGADGGPNHGKVRFPQAWNDLQQRQKAPGGTVADLPDLPVALALPGGAGVMQFRGDTKAELAADAYLLACCIQHIRADSGRFWRIGFRKFLRTWAPVPNWVNAGFFPYGLLMLLSYVPVLFLSLWGVRLFRAHWRTVWILAVPAVYLSAVHFVYMGSARYRIPAEICLLILAAGVLDHLTQKRDPLASGKPAGGALPSSGKLL